MEKVVYLAQKIKIGNQEIEGPLKIGGGDVTLGAIISRILVFIVPLASVILFFVIIWGGFDLLMSAGEGKKIESAKNKITAGIIGFGLLVFAYAITKLIAYIFGLNTGGIF